ncbi:MAG: hypothetical protein K2N60_02520 [Oscillospiraceae bacterium]|nr:hypothetical protein [Oscillospiraceae bacterium]
MKKIFGGLKAAACGAAAAAVMLTMSGCTNYSKMLSEQPAEYISMAQENTMKAVVGGGFGAECKLLQEASENGSFKLDFEVEGLQFNGELYVNEKDGKAAQVYKLTGTEGTSAEVYIYAGKDGLKFGTDGNSGRHVYDVTFEGFAEKLAASIFAPDSGSEYAMEQSEYDTFIQYIEEISSAAAGEDTESADKLSAIVEDYMAAHPPVTEENVESDIGGETVSANIVTYSFAKEDIVSIAEQLTDLYLEEYADEQEFEYYTKDEMKEQIMSTFDELDDCSIKVVHYVNSKSHMLMMSDIDMLASADGENMCFYVDVLYGADPENSNKQSFKAGVSADGEEYAIAADITMNDNGSETVFSLTDNGETSELATLSSNRDGENYTITLDIPDAEISCKAEGTVKTGGKSFEITLDRISAVNGSTEVSYLPKGVVTVEKGGAMPALDAEKEFLDITEEELDTLLENIESDFSAVMEETAPGSAMGNYIRKSKISSANANAKMCHTTVMTTLIQAVIDDQAFSGSEISNSGKANFSIGGTEVDCTDYLGESFEGYVYGEFDGEDCTVNYILWSEDPIPDNMKKPLSYDEQTELAEQGTYIGCYPLQ